MYHVTGTITVATLLYLISFYFYKTGFYTNQFHRKLWNSILALAFLTTAIAGIFLALQANNKWDLRITDTILKWHVEFGIGLAITGLFHFIWHLTYYFGKGLRAGGRGQGAEGSGRRAEGRERGTEGEGKKAENGESDVSTSLFVIGFVSSAVQLLFLREIMNITGGYELVSGVFFGSWLITSAAGSSVAGKSFLENMRKILSTFSLAPLISLFLMLFLSRLFMITGQTPTFLESFIYILLVIGPFCFVSGFTFVRLLDMGRKSKFLNPGRSFSIETIGGVLAGIFVSIMAAGFLNTYELILIIVLLANAFTLLNSFSLKPRHVFIVKILTILLVIIILEKDTDRFFRQILLPGIRVTRTTDTPYGNITTGVSNGENSMFYNQRLFNYSEDVAQREEDIHYAMLQSNNPGNILLVSGSLRSHLPEILKYPVKKIIYIERDPALIESEESLIRNPGSEISISEDDAFRFIRKTDQTFDVMLLLVPPPSTFLLNRYYTTEFFRSAKQKLTREGIFMCSPGMAENYYNKESLQVISSVYNSLKKVFRNVLPVAGTKLYFIASDKELSAAISSLTVEKGIQNYYVGPDYLSDDLIMAKSSEITGLIDPEIKENTLSFPVACMGFQSLIFSMKAGEKIPAILLMLLVFAVPAILIRRKNLIMFTAACSLAGFEIILLLALQLSVGNMYQITGLILASVMAGLATGAISEIKLPWKLRSKNKVLFLVIIYLMAVPSLSFLHNFNNQIVIVVFLLVFSFIPGVITGNLFRDLASGKASIVPDVYSADLTGSATGFIIISAIAVPVIGITLSVFLLALINFAGFLFGTAPANE